MLVKSSRKILQLGFKLLEIRDSYCFCPLDDCFFVILSFLRIQSSNFWMMMILFSFSAKLFFFLLNISAKLFNAFILFQFEFNDSPICDNIFINIVHRKHDNVRFSFYRICYEKNCTDF